MGVRSSVVVGLGLGLGLCADVRGAIVFEERFEEPDLQARGWYDFDPADAVLTQAEAYEGSYSLEITLQPGQQSTSGLRLPLPDMDVVYLRFHQKFASDWPWHGGNFTPHNFRIMSASQFQAPTQVPINLMVEAVEMGRARLALGLTGQGGGNAASYYGADAGVFTLGDWHVMDAMIQLNDPGQSNGEIRMWVDGELQIEQTGLQIRYNPDTLVLNQLLYGLYYHGGAPTVATVWTDHVIVADAPLGDPDPPGGSTGTDSDGGGDTGGDTTPGDDGGDASDSLDSEAGEGGGASGSATSGGGGSGASGLDGGGTNDDGDTSGCGCRAPSPNRWGVVSLCVVLVALRRRRP